MKKIKSGFSDIIFLKNVFFVQRLITITLVILFGCSANQESKQLVTVAKNKDFNGIYNLLEKANNLNFKDEKGFTALYYITVEKIYVDENLKEYEEKSDKARAEYKEALNKSMDWSMEIMDLINKNKMTDAKSAEGKELSKYADKLKIIADHATNKYNSSQKYRFELLKLLNTMVTKGASLSIKMDNGKSIMDIAKEKSPDDLYQTFEKW